MIQYLTFTVIFSSVVYYLLHQVKGPIRSFRLFYYNRIRYKNNLTRQKFILINNILVNHCPYYVALNDKGKAKFITRLNRFVNATKWIGAERLQLTNEMRYVIGSAAIQITFGFSDNTYMFPSISRVIIYPDAFYNRMIRRNLKGGTTSNTVMLSWRHTLEGYADPDDNLNLALHEFAHALKLYAEQGGMENFFGTYITNWLAISAPEQKRLRAREDSFLRAYGGTNDHEFFAVSVEHFFESPEQFKQELPDIFNHLCVLLNQNPLAVETAYMLTDEYLKSVNRNSMLIPVPKVRFKNEVYANKYYITLFFMSPVFFIFTFYLTIDTYITFNDIKWFLLIGTLSGCIISYKRLMKTELMIWPIFIFFQATGYLSIHLATFFLLNTLLPIGHHQMKFTAVNVVSGGIYSTPKILTPDPLVNDMSFSNSLSLESLFSNHQKEKDFEYVLEMNEGIMGFDVAYSSYLTFSFEPKKDSTTIISAIDPTKRYKLELE